jgi:hypothetical protein
MERTGRWGSWLLILGLMGVCVGCDFATLTYFLLPEPRQPAQLKRLAEDGKKIKVVLLVDMGLETRPEFVQADVDLANLLARQLQTLFKENKEDVELVPQREVELYKSTNPGWRENFDPAEVGRHFEAQRVVYLEIRSLSLYEKGSLNTMYRGHADLTISVIEVEDPNQVPERKFFTTVYPGDPRGGVAVGDMTAMEFRQHFLNYLAKKLSWHFADYRQQDTYFLE